jgi:hypothetical protein
MQIKLYIRLEQTKLARLRNDCEEAKTLCSLKNADAAKD